MKILRLLLLALAFAALGLPTADAQQYTNTARLCVPTNSTSCPSVTTTNPLPTTGYGGGAITNPTSTLTLPSATTAYTAGQLIANSGTANAVVVPSFSISTAGGGALIGRLRLTTNDSTSTAWGAQTIQVDLWSVAPTFTNGDRGPYSPATGTGGHLATYSCTFSAEYGDGAYSSCGISVGSALGIKLASGTAIYWTLQALSGSGTTGASKVFTLTAEVYN